MCGVSGLSRGFTESYHCSHVKVETMHVKLVRSVLLDLGLYSGDFKCQYKAVWTAIVARLANRIADKEVRTRAKSEKRNDGLGQFHCRQLFMSRTLR